MYIFKKVNQVVQRDFNRKLSSWTRGGQTKQGTWMVFLYPGFILCTLLISFEYGGPEGTVQYKQIALQTKSKVAPQTKNIIALQTKLKITLQAKLEITLQTIFKIALRTKFEIALQTKFKITLNIQVDALSTFQPIVLQSSVSELSYWWLYCVTFPED